MNEHRKKSNSDPKCATCGFSSLNLQLIEHHKRKRNCKKCFSNGFNTSFECIKQYNAHIKDCRAQGLENKDVNVVDVDVVILKEEFQPETINHSQDMPVLEERSVEQFQTARPLPKRRRIACLKTFAISTA